MHLYSITFYSYCCIINIFAQNLDLKSVAIFMRVKRANVLVILKFDTISKKNNFEYMYTVVSITDLYVQIFKSLFFTHNFWILY